MPSPFYDGIKGTCATAGAPGTGAFTPDAAAPSGYRPWSKAPVWIGMVRYVDGNDWELSWGYWNGSTISRGTNQFYDSSTGSPLSLSASATAAMVVHGGDIMSHIGETSWRGWSANPNATALSAFGITTATLLGTASQPGGGNTNILTEQARLQLASATTANAQAGEPYATNYLSSNSNAGRGGWEYVARFGATQLPTGPRLFAGVSSVSLSGNTSEPSALVAHLAVFGKDSTDTNIQLMTNSGAGGSTKINTTISWAINDLYEAAIWTEPGSTTIYALLIRYGTGEIWFGSTTTDVPASATLMSPQIIAGLSGTTGTALQFQFVSMFIRNGP